MPKIVYVRKIRIRKITQFVEYSYFVFVFCKTYFPKTTSKLNFEFKKITIPTLFVANFQILSTIIFLTHMTIFWLRCRAYSWYSNQWVIIICSKFDCSKNLLDTVRAIIFFLVNCSNPVNLWELT